MNVFRKSKLPLLSVWCVLSMCCGLAIMPEQATADDIDIFIGTSAGSSDAPNVIFLIDNGPNWSRAAQHWPDNGGIQGAAELAAISAELNQINTQQPANVGVAMLSSYAGTTANGSTPGSGGGYIRFAARDMTVSANKVALQNILNGIAANINSPNEKLTGMSSKDEAAGFYEIYKYLSGLAPFTGPYGSSYSAQNGYVDVSNNSATNTAAGQGLTSGFAISNGLYQSPISSGKPCARTYIIYIANNANQTGSIGQAAYQPTVANTAPALLATPGLDTWTDEWTSFLYNSGAVVPAGNNNGSVITYVLDAYKAQQNGGYSNSLQGAATRGGGKYFQVGSQNDIQAALATIFVEIQAVNTTFASASLPVNAANKTYDDNEVFIPMFRPDPNDQPRWMGNLKRYALNTSIQLIDMMNVVVVNPLTGYATPCATSFWSSDSGSYWNFTPEGPLAKGQCPGPSAGGTNLNSPYSDTPDGPIVEKGGVAEVIRKGNNPPTTNTTPTWAVNRTLYTQSGTSLPLFATSATSLPASLVSWVSGVDINDENTDGSALDTRPSVHGDTIHSRPLAVDYGPTGQGMNNVVVYYGSNDGTLRAVDANSGQEKWALIAPEFYTPAPAVYPTTTPTGFERLMWSGMVDSNGKQISPLISFPGIASGLTPTPVPKDYYWDGSIGLYEGAFNPVSKVPSKVWIYPSMRRGGRMIYALDVTTPGSPQFLWKAGCPNPAMTNTSGCTANMTTIGQTWSTPMPAASVLGYTGPVVIVGGGYDPCEDANTATPSCSTPNGAGVYVLDAHTGALVASFATTRSVAADVALISASSAGTVDHAYAVDTGGNIYRIDFAASTSNWAIHRVAYTNGAGRKFLFAPALLLGPSQQVYLALGSGDREHPLQSEYPFGGVVNRFYVYRDDLMSTAATNLDDTSVMYDYTTNPSCSAPGVLPNSAKKGWFMNLNQFGQGEQTVTAAIIAAGMVAFSTNRPIPQAQGTCSTALGVAEGYWVNLLNASGAIGVPAASCGGTRAVPFVGGGLPPSPVIATVALGANGTDVATVVIGASQLSGAPSSPIGSQRVQPSITPTRKQVYWKSSGEN